MDNYIIYLNHLNSLGDRDFIKAMDLAFALKEKKIKIMRLQSNIDEINKQIDDLQKKLKTISREIKPQIIEEIKQLGRQKNEYIENINNLVSQIDRQGDGLKVKLSRMSSDSAYEKATPGKKGFVDYMSDIATDNVELNNKFVGKIADNYEFPYLSEYSKHLSRQARLDETSGNIYDNITTLDSFRDKNSRSAQRVFDSALTRYEIGSYLKRKGGKNRTKKRRNKRRNKNIRKGSYKKRRF